MHTVAVIGQKGGVGKTTIGVNLAVAAEAAGQATLLVDLDPQQSAAAWADDRDSDTPYVLSGHVDRLQAILDTARAQGAGLALIDTAPHHESSALAAARVADLVLLPVRPSLLDLRALVASHELTHLVGARAAVVLNSVPPRGSRADEAASAIATHSMELCPVRIGLRIALVDATNSGRGVMESEPRGKAAAEVQALYEWMSRSLEEKR